MVSASAETKNTIVEMRMIRILIILLLCLMLALPPALVGVSACANLEYCLYDCAESPTSNK